MKRYVTVVSILVLLDVWWVRLSLLGVGLVLYKVSILVLLDVWWVRIFHPPYTNNGDVSILVLLDVWWVLGEVAVCDFSRQGSVSILVLLDVWWVHCVSRGLGENHGDFVSILVLLDVWWVLLKLWPKRPKNKVSRSLFYWMFGGYAT